MLLSLTDDYGAYPGLKQSKKLIGQFVLNQRVHIVLRVPLFVYLKLVKFLDTFLEHINSVTDTIDHEICFC